MNPLLGNPDATPGEDILRWMRLVRARLRQSPWEAVLSSGTVDAWEALLSPIYIHLLGLARASDSGARRAQIIPRVLARLRGGMQAWTEARPRRVRRSAWERGAVVFWPREPNHAQIQVPVMQALREAGRDSWALTNTPGLLGELRTLGERGQYARNAWPKRTARARSDASALVSCLDEEPDTRDWPALRGGAQGPEIAAVLRQVLKAGLPLVSETVATVSALVEEWAPVALVVGNDLTTEGRVACLEAQLLGLPTVCIQHGTLAEGLHHSRHVADRFLAFGEAARRLLEGLGVRPEALRVCGNPEMDRRPSQTGQISPALQSRFHLENGSPWVLVALSGPGHSVSHAHHRAVVRALGDCARRMPRVPFVAKLHKKDALGYYQEATQAEGRSLLLGASQNDPGLPSSILEWLQGCPVLVTGASGSAIDAMVMGVPVITVDLMDELGEIDFIANGISFHATDTSGLERLLSDILAGGAGVKEHRRRVTAFLRDTLGELDGRAAARCADAIQELADHAPPEAVAKT